MKATRFYIIVTVTGAVIMALEILSSRILAPEFGNSVFVWGSIISVFLAALSLGYYLGGRLADYEPRLGVLGRLLCLAAAFQLALLMVGRQVTAAIGSLTHGSPAGTLLATTALFGAPSVLLATVSPFVVRLAARDMAQLGNTAGRLYALSTAGSLVGTLACTFIMIPNLAVHQNLGILLLATCFVALLAMAQQPRLDAVFVVLGVVVALAGFRYMTVTPALPNHVLHLEVTPYQTLEIREIGGRRSLYGDRTLYSAINVDDGSVALLYQKYITAALLINPEIKSTLVLGMGSGGMGKVLRQAVPASRVDYVEIDPAVQRLAEEYFGFSESADLQVHIQDGRQFLRNTDRSWDYILGNVYIGVSVPFHLTTAEFCDVVKDHLNPDGVYGINLASGMKDPFPKAIFHTLTTKFKHVFVFSVRAAPNVFVMATDAEINLPRDEMLRRGKELDDRMPLDPTLSSVAAARLEVTLDPREAMILTDRFAPANHLISLSAGDSDVQSLAGQ